MADFILLIYALRVASIEVLIEALMNGLDEWLRLIVSIDSFD